jgi:hypothetical protein
MRVKTEWGTWTVSSCPKASLSASATKMAVTAKVGRQGGKLQKTTSRCFDK